MIVRLSAMMMVQMLLGVESPNPGWVLAGHVSAVVQHAQPSIQTQPTPGRTQRSCLFLVRLQPTLLHLLLLPFYFCGCVHCCEHWSPVPPLPLELLEARSSGELNR